MSRAVKVTLITVAVILVVVVVGIGLLAYNFGAFENVELQQAVRGPYQIVCLEHIGPYQQAPAKIEKVKAMLQEKNITIGNACGIYHDDPAKVPSDQLRSRVGFIVEDSVSVEAPFMVDSLAQREVIIGTIKAHPAVAPFKTYPKMQAWMQGNDYEPAGPAFEIYREDGVVEGQMPIRKKEARPGDAIFFYKEPVMTKLCGKM